MPKKKHLLFRTAILLAVITIGIFFVPQHHAQAAGQLSIVAKNGALAAGFSVKLKKTKYLYQGGNRVTPTFTVKYGKKTLAAGKDYTYWTTNAKAVGTATLAIKGTGSYKGIFRTTYQIVRRSSKYITAKTNYQTYNFTGKARKPGVRVFFKSGGKTMQLKNGRDFTLSYSGNTYPGTGTVKIRYKDSYSGSAKLSFTIKRPASGSYPVAAILAKKAGTVLPEGAVDFQNLGLFYTISGITPGDAVYNRIIGKSYRENPDIALSKLRYLKFLHRNYEGKIQLGELICNAAVAAEFRAIFLELFQIGYQIEKALLVDEYWTGDGLTTDEVSVRQNNTSAFNYRQASDAPNLSNHAFGRAIDLNPLHNPYISLTANGWATDPPIAYGANEQGYTDPAARAGGLPHALTANDPCVRIFKNHGFTWGGDWGGASRDYQHFERLV